MYYYVFEPPREAKEYERTAAIKEYLSKLGIAGEMASPTPGKTVEDLVSQAIKKRYSTIIAVGGIEFVNRVARGLEEHDVVFGIIPTHENVDIANLIGVSDWKTAADQLKRRRWQTLRLGLMNKQICFLTPVTVEIPADANLIVKTPTYSLQAPSGYLITIRPLSLPEYIESETLGLNITPLIQKKGGFLRSLFLSKTEENRETYIHNVHIDLLSDNNLPVMVAGTILARTPVQFSIQEKALKLIVGKGSNL